MKTIVNALLALAIATLASTAYAVEPKEMQSLQPFQSFAKGAGEGVAREYIARDKAQFVAWMRTRKGMRTTCEVLVRQMAEAHPGLPFEGCEGAAAAIEHDDNFAVVSCEDQMFMKDNWLAVTNEQGSAWGVWHRKCLAKEQVLVYKGQPLISTTCGNVAVPTPRIIVTIRSAPQRLSPLATLPAACPAFYFLKVNVWEHSALALPGVEMTHAKEEFAKKEPQNRFVGVPHVSRTHGGQFRKALAAGQTSRSPSARTFQVSLIMTPEATGGGDSSISAEEVLGTVVVTGVRELQFTRAQIEKWDAIRVIDLKGDITSPPRSGLSSFHELRFFNHLPGTKLGEWENNPVPDCIMNEHWIE